MMAPLHCCPLVHKTTMMLPNDLNGVVLNHEMFSAAGNQIGDVCEGDTDGDGVTDKDDHCPRNPSLQGTYFRPHTVVDLLPGINQSDWQFTDNGAEVRQLAHIDRPAMLIGESMGLRCDSLLT